MKAAMKRIVNIDIRNIKDSNLNEQGIYIKFNEVYARRLFLGLLTQFVELYMEQRMNTEKQEFVKIIKFKLNANKFD